MFFSWFSPKRQSRTPRRGSGLAKTWLRLEHLEDRCVPAGTVTILSVQGPSATSAVVPAATAGDLTSPALIATFTDTNAVNPSNLAVRIDYGDGSPVQTNQAGPNFDPNLQVTQAQNNPNQYIVSDKHDFAKTPQSIQPYKTGDTFPITLTVSEVANPANTDTNMTGTAEVFAAPLAASLTPPTVTAVAGTAFTGPVAAFTDTDPNVSASDFTAVITWGDGHTSNGTIQADVNGGFDVIGTNTYATANNYSINVTVTNANGGIGAGDVQPNVSINVTATVTAATGGTTTGGTTTGGTTTGTTTGGTTGGTTTGGTTTGGTTTGGTTTGGTTTGGTTTGGTTTGGTTGSSTTGGTTTGGTTTGGTTTGGTTTGGTTTGGTTTGGTTTGGTTTGSTTTGTTQGTVTPSVSIGFNPKGGGAMLAVNSSGELTQYDNYGAHDLGGGVKSASIAFDAFGNEVILLVRTDGTLMQYDRFGAHNYGGGVESASLFFSPAGEAILVVSTNGSLTQYDAFGAHFLVSGGVQFASACFAGKQEVVVVTGTNGVVTQYDSTGAHILGNGDDAAAIAAGIGGEVIDIISAAGTITQYGPNGPLTLGTIT